MRFLMALIFAGIFFASYMMSVGIAALLQYLVNLTFHTQYDVNIWLAGLLLYVIWLFFSGARK
jgi:hypothetical protein